MSDPMQSIVIETHEVADSPNSAEVSVLVAPASSTGTIVALPPGAVVGASTPAAITGSVSAAPEASCGGLGTPPVAAIDSPMSHWVKERIAQRVSTRSRLARMNGRLPTDADLAYAALDVSAQVQQGLAHQVLTRSDMLPAAVAIARIVSTLAPASYRKALNPRVIDQYIRAESPGKRGPQAKPRLENVPDASVGDALSPVIRLHVKTALRQGATPEELRRELRVFFPTGRPRKLAKGVEPLVRALVERCPARVEIDRHGKQKKKKRASLGERREQVGALLGVSPSEVRDLLRLPGKR